MSFYLIKSIASNEMRTLLRSWFFRIFALLAIVGLIFFNAAIYIDKTGAPWIYRALASSIPYVNLIVLNLGQAIVAIFLASEFLKQDRKNDTVEVIYARSISNGEYILGKTLGILSVFLILNIIVLCIGIGFSFFSDDSARDIFTFFAYPLLISLPTLVFILGLSFFLMVLLKNQAVTFILLLGYIALSVFYLNTKAYHLFDYIAYNVPMTYTPLGGFGNISEIVLHRSIFLLAGIGLIFFTIYKLPRLPQSKRLPSLPLMLAIVFISFSGLLMYYYYTQKESNIIYKQKVLQINDFYVNYPKINVISCNLELGHHGQEISVKATLAIKNQQPQQVDTILFSLNPLLSLSSVQVNGKPYSYIRTMHLLKIPYEQGLKPGDSLKLNMQYSGKVDERVCFVDLANEESKDNFNLELFNIRKRYAFINENFVCLTSESLWYPVSGAGYSSTKPFYHTPDFTRYSLKVKTNPKYLVISQGKPARDKNGISKFTPEYPLPQISLLIGPYSQYKTVVDSVEYSLYTFKSSQSFPEYFSEISDSIKTVIRELKRDYENKTGLKYPFKRFALAEVPVHFVPEKHVWSVASDAVQPEMVLFPEKGVLLYSLDLRRIKLRLERNMKEQNEEILPKGLKIRMVKKIIGENILARQGGRYYSEVADKNSYHVLPQYLSFAKPLYSEKWPVLDLAVQTYFSEMKNKEEDNYSNTGFTRIIFELKKSSLETLLNKGIQFKDNKEGYERTLTVKDVAMAKGSYLFNLWGAQYGQKKIDTVLRGIVSQNIHKPYSFLDFTNAFFQIRSLNTEAEIQNWYSKKALPGILLKDVETYKVIDGDFTRYQVRFKISNPEQVDAYVSVYCENYQRKIFVPARSAREVGFLLAKEAENLNINTYLAENLPDYLQFDFKGFSNTLKVKALDTIQEYPLFTSLEGSNETVVDNEDKGFSLVQPQDQAFLKSLLYKRAKSAIKYGHFEYWDPPGRWEPILRSGNYGRYVNSVYYTKAGTGDLKAIWKASLQKGYYEVSFYHQRVPNWGRRKKKTDYNLIVYHDGGAENIVLNTDELEEGWNSLGTYYLSSDTAKVEMSNKSKGNIVFADAIKWSRVN